MFKAQQRTGTTLPRTTGGVLDAERIETRGDVGSVLNKLAHSGKPRVAGC
jgi:hypothetical protein